MSNLPYSRKMLGLAEKWLNGSITDQEKTEFTDWYNHFNDEELLLAPEYQPVIKQLEEEMLISIRKRIAADVSPPSSQDLPDNLPNDFPQQKGDSPKEGGALYRMKWFRVSAAAALIAVLATGAWFFVGRKGPGQAPLTAQKSAPPAPADVLPGSNKALLTLDDGSTIALDSAKSGSLTRQGNTRVLKSEDGQLKYEPVTGDNAVGVSYNILSTPKGGQYKLVLPDGSQVWLNAASSIRYPAAFSGKERKVEVSGEAYFEITKNASMPFRVLVDHQLKAIHPMEIEVLGTHFNVNAYADETAIRTTLLEGLVKVAKGASSRLLRPGQQAQLQDNGEIRWIPDADTENAVAWKNGVFEFGDENLQTVMRQISRWYDVEVVYEGNIPADRFTGRVSRNTSLSGVLKILKLSDIRFTIENKKIIIRS
jgi:ferric-dicitrate binding protein FerR (iron transport regulator)